MQFVHLGFYKSILTTTSKTLTALHVAVVMLLAGCSDSGTPAPATDESSAGATSAMYRLTFNASWSVGTHPLDFPEGAFPHFSSLAGAVHNEQVRFWEPGQPATSGIQQVAETGNRSIFFDEVQTAIDAGTATASINGSGTSDTPDTTSVEFTVTRSYPEITIVTMLAPSPDWFVGLHNYSLLENDAFIDNATISLRLYDSGTDDGLRYQSANAPASTAAPIMLLTSDPSDTPFINGEPAVGTFVIDRLQ